MPGWCGQGPCGSNPELQHWDQANEEAILISRQTDLNSYSKNNSTISKNKIKK
jgi:hypothetical protein